MDYLGENLLPGYLGHFFVTLSVVASLVASFAYFKTVQSKLDTNIEGWKKLARIAFITEVVSVFAIFSILFYIIYNHLFEYKYAWQHSSRSLEMKYLLSCFWEGQEGSFLLWSIWHCVLGLIIIRRGKQWEAPVMSVVSLAQFALATMGYYFFDKKVGSNPFVLLRNEMDAPIFMQPNYLSFIKDGNDLNPLLQNYWMVIHPPVLFLGFASTIIPFAYAVAGLWTKNYSWTKAALPWSLFSAAVLGVGIMMGGAWAYESLNFGGYWAWDPVENASLVPWLTLVAGIHTLLIFNHTGRSLKATLIFFILSFSLVLYSTFLTRSGILGDTSVHAFTDLGMNAQLYLLLYVFSWLAAVAAANNFKERMYTIAAAVVLLVAGYFLPVVSLLSVLLAYFLCFFSINKAIPSAKEEEQTTSREFWMFIGSLILSLSALFIIIATSLPVINKLFNKNFTMGEDVVHAYNNKIIFVAIIIGLLTAIGQYFKYKSTSLKFFWKKISWPTVISLVISALILGFGKINYLEKGPGFLAAIYLAMVAAVYAVVANAAYIWIGLKGKLKLSGGSITHFGFGMMLVGILISSSKKEILSWNTSGIYVPMGEGSKENAGENLTLVKGVPTKMGEFLVTYTSEEKHPKKDLWVYHLKFTDKNGKEKFTLSPNAFVNYKGNQGLMANPDAKHYWDHDIFTYITSLPDPAKNKDTANFKPVRLKLGDTSFYNRGYFILQDVLVKDSVPAADMAPDDKVYMATIKVVSKDSTSYTSKPVLISKGGNLFPIEDTVISEDLIFQLKNATATSVEMGVKEPNSVLKFITLKALKFPFINLLWLGTIIMAAGFFVSMVRRIQLNRNADAAEKFNL